MNQNVLVTLPRRSIAHRAEKARDRIWLVKPPYFTPWTPPLGISILKAFLEQHGFSATCYDYNTDPELWGMHHKYFSILQAQEEVSTNDGYSKLWAVLNAHMLAYLNHADAENCARVVTAILPLYGIEPRRGTVDALIPLIERYFDRLGELTDEVSFSDYSVVGTSTYTTSLSSSLFVLGRIKRRYPHITTVMGGGVFADDLALGSDNLNTLVEEYPYVDHVVLGEGELLFLKLLQGELSHKRVVSIADLEGKTLNMQDVPSPDFSDFNSERYYHLTIEGARSCPFQCSFCSETVQWGDYRKKAVDLFAEQVVDLAERFKNNSFFMGDSLMNPYIVDLSKQLLEMKANVLYDGYLRADKPVMNRDRVKLWARSGLFRVRLGIESASARVLASMDKMTTPHTISEVLKSLASAGIRTTTYWIVGFPNETEQDFQETLDFIRDHYKFIYELEAHPYYYYPYGQIGSRLYQSYSIYPDQVTELIKFKSWDVPNVSPAREERFERLRRISKLASELGIPNIYSMEERYEAEDRWRLLHPLAIEVYKGSHILRTPPAPAENPIPVFSAERIQGGANGSGPHAVVCYEAGVHKTIDPEVLSRSIAQLIRYNELLQVRLENGNYISVREAGEEGYGSCLFVQTDGAHDPGNREAIKSEVIARLSAEMRPEPGASIRVALFSDELTESSILLLVHHAIADAGSVVLLFEDLFRIYEQLSDDREVALGAIEKSYSDFAAGLSGMNGSADDWARQSHATHGVRELAKRNVTVKTTYISLDANLTRRVFSDELTQHGLTPAQLLLLAAIRSFGKLGLNREIRLDTTQDYRTGDKSLARTLGPLTRIVQLPPDCLADDNPGSVLRRIHQVLGQPARINKDAGSAGFDGATGPHERVLLNLEYFGQEPWLGGDSWLARGFVTTGGLDKTYELEIAPIVSGGLIQAQVKYKDTEDLAGIVNGLMDHSMHSYKASVRMILNYLRSGANF